MRELIWLRRSHPVFRRRVHLRGEVSPLTADVRWHGRIPHEPDFSPESRFLAYTLDGRYHGRDDVLTDRPDNDFYVAMNGSPEPVLATVPLAPTARRWRQLIDTSADSPTDFFLNFSGSAVKPGKVITIAPFATHVLISEGEF
jgi:pullulanase/glycogen debranching enzyme